MSSDTPTVFSSRAADDDLWADLEARRVRRVAARSQVNGVVVARIKEIKQRAPWLQAGVVAALAQSPVDLDGAEFRQLMTAGAKVKQKKHGWGPLGAVVRVSGSALGVGGRVLDRALGGVDEALGDVAKPVVRGAALSAQSAWEEAEGAVRNVAAWRPGGIPVGGAVAGAGVVAGLVAAAPVTAGAAAIGGAAAVGGALGAAGGTQVEGKGRWEPQSRGAVALGQFLHGDDVALGHGFLPHPGRSIEAEVKRRERVTINGHAVTPGRLLAAGVVEPGTKPYNVLSGLVDGATALSDLDPTAAVGRAAGNINRNRKLFVEAGGLLADRPAIVPEVAQAWWTGRADLREWMAGTDFHDIWTRTKGKLGADVTHALSEADTPEKVDAVIRPLLGVHNALRGPLDVSYRTFRPLENVRLLKSMPGPVIDLRDADQSVETIERWLQNAKAPQELIAKHTAAMAAAQTRVGRYDAVRATMDATKDLLVDKGWDDGFARQLTQMVEGAGDDTRGYFVNQVGDNVNVPGMWARDPNGLPKPHAYAEFIDQALPLPDVRDIRAATSMFRPLLKQGAAWKARDIGTSALDFLQGNIWKRAALLRGAYTVRVIGEEQLRMAASGLDSLVNHPLSLIAHRLSEESVLGRAAARAGMDVGKGAVDVAGNAFRYRDADEFAEGLDEYNKALNREFSFNGWAESGRRVPVWKKVQPGHAEFEEAWADELAKLANDPIHREAARALTRGDSLDTLHDAFWNGNLAGYRKTMAEEATGLASRDVADRYIDSVADRLQYTTGGDGDLLDMITTGRFGGAPVRRGLKGSDELRGYLASSGDIAPEYLYRQVSLAERGGQAKKFYDDVTQYLFSNLMAERTNNLSRSPTFRQFYWQRAEELAPFMDEASKTTLLRQARAAKLDDVADRISVTSKSGDLTLDAADHLAKGFALDNTRDLLYDMSERGQFFDAARMIFPFGEAWKELVTRWARIGVERPQALRRAQQVVTGARQSGFFHTNSYGQEVFEYPGSGWVSEKLYGIPVPLTGRVAGLSLMTDVLPGVGPMVQIPAGALLPDKPDFDTIRGIVFPFGEPETSSGLVESFLPAWVQKLRQTGALEGAGIHPENGQWLSAVGDVMRYLASTGKYDTSTVDGMRGLIDAAVPKAKVMFAMRGAAQFFAPTAPTPEWVVRDKNGDVLVAQKLVEEYHDLLEEDPENAFDDMMDKYGEGLFLLMQGKTAEVTPAAPVSKEGVDWERSHRAIAHHYPNAYGFFAPQGGDLDPVAYGRQVAAGKRQRLTPEQTIRLANDRVAFAVYDKARRDVGPKPSRAQTQALRNLRQVLIEEYPGFTDRSGIPEKVSTDTLVRELSKAVADPKLEDNPQVEPIRIYLEARRDAEQGAQARGLAPGSFRSAAAMAPARTALRALGDTLVAEYPGFLTAWERVFERELTDEEEGEG